MSLPALLKANGATATIQAWTEHDIGARGAQDPQFSTVATGVECFIDRATGGETWTPERVNTVRSHVMFIDQPSYTITEQWRVIATSGLYSGATFNVMLVRENFKNHHLEIDLEYVRDKAY